MGRYIRCKSRGLIPHVYQGIRSKNWKRGYRKPEAWVKNEGKKGEEWIIVEYSPFERDWIVYHHPSGKILAEEKKKFLAVYCAARAVEEANANIPKEERVWWG